VTDQERSIQRAKVQPRHPWRVWHGTSEQAKEVKEKADRVVPLHTRVIR